VAFVFSLGVFEEMCPLAEALDAPTVAVGKTSVHRQDASTTGIEAFATATDELVASGGAEDCAVVLGADAFEDEGLITEGFGAEVFGF
jgi:hypothetical protein